MFAKLYKVVVVSISEGGVILIKKRDKARVDRESPVLYPFFY